MKSGICIPMKIVRIIARLNVGGPARHVVWLTKAFSTDGSESVLVAGTVPAGEEDMGYFAEINGVSPVFIPEMSRELSPKDAISLWKVFRLLVRERPDIVHTHTAKAGTVGRIAGFLYRWLLWRDVRIVHTFHGHVFHSYYGRLKTRVFLAIEKTLARTATDRIIVISERQRSEICDEFGVGDPSKFAVVPLGLDLEAFSAPVADRDAIRAEFGAATDDLVVGFVGRLTEIKNIPMLLEAAAAIPPDLKMKFVIIGDGHLRPELETLAAKLEAQDRVKFAGNRNDSDRFYFALDAVALTSRNEGTPLTLIEAMACGRPFVATNVGGVTDLAGDVIEPLDGFEVRERGLTVASGDVEGFANALRFLLAERGRLDEIGLNGRAFVESKYSRERLVSDIRRLYRDLLADR